MTKQHRTIAQAESERAARQQREQDAVRQLAREEQEARRQRDLEEAAGLVEEHRQNKPAPAKMDRYGNLQSPSVEGEPTGPSEAWLAYARAMADYEAKRLEFAAMGVTLHQGPPQPPKEGAPRDQLSEAERQRRALLGIPAKPGVKIVPLAPPQDLGQHPDADTYRE